MSKEYVIKNSDGDYLLIQNYVLQLVAEKKLTHTAFVLYAFYRSIAGFDEIKMGYRYIAENSGVSQASISKCNRMLVNEGLIKISNNGRGNPFMIEILPGYYLPRRQLKKPKKYIREPENLDIIEDEYNTNIEHEEFNDKNMNKNSSTVHDKNTKKSVHQVNSKCSQDKQINISNKNKITTKGEEIVIDDSKIEIYNKLIKKIIKTWKKQTGSRYYTKNDINQVYKIIEPEEALKYVDTMWSLDEVDEWTRKSDHTISVFVYLYLNGKLQAHFKNTRASIKSAWDL